MKKMILAVLLACAPMVTMGAYANNWPTTLKFKYYAPSGQPSQPPYSYVIPADNSRWQYDNVCHLKMIASRKFQLNPYRIVIKLDDKTLREGVTLKDLGVGNNTLFGVYAVEKSTQCENMFPGFSS